MADLLVEQWDRVRVLTLNRPDVLNAISRTLATEIVNQVEEAEDDEETRVIVIRGSGRDFSAGYD
ncbi:MAG: enoyl-CoA hydratase/isomerase family protein, partial [Acidimicrobiia bacterium]